MNVSFWVAMVGAHEKVVTCILDDSTCNPIVVIDKLFDKSFPCNLYMYYTVAILKLFGE